MLFLAGYEFTPGLINQTVMFLSLDNLSHMPLADPNILNIFLYRVFGELVGVDLFDLVK